MTIPVQPYLHSYSLRFHFQHQPGFDVFAFLERANQEGFVGVCLSANGPNYRHLGGGEAIRLQQIRRRLQALQLQCDIDTSGTDPSHLGVLLEVARSIGAQHLRTYTRHRGDIEQIASRTMEDLASIAPVAAEMGVVVLLENHETFTGGEIAQILDQVNNPWIGALFDYGNSQMVMEDPAEALRAMVKHTKCAHLKDHLILRPEQAPNGMLSVLGVPVGLGALPIVELTRALWLAECPRIAFESSWGYWAPVKPERLTPHTSTLLGKGSFRFAGDNLTNDESLLRPEAFAPLQLVKMEDEAHRRGLAWLGGALANAGIPVASAAFRP